MLIKVPGASHSIAARPSQSAARVSAILAWFDRYRTQGHLVVRATVFEAAHANTSGSTSPVNQRIAARRKFTRYSKPIILQPRE
jgi:hypothetical protein